METGSRQEKEMANTSQGIEEMSRDHLYIMFNENVLDTALRATWREGTLCDSLEPFFRNSMAHNRTYIYCPMPFEEDVYTECCGTLDKRRCCQPSGDNHSSPMKWGIGFGVMSCVILLLLVFACLYNRCSAICTRTRPHEAPRLKLKPHSNKTNVNPLDKRIVLKTANYTVEQVWEELMIKFCNTEYYRKFCDALVRKYPLLGNGKEAEVSFPSSHLSQVRIRLVKESDAVIVAGCGNSIWLKSDFQSVCKNINVLEVPERTLTALPLLRTLSPRLPTIGEEFYDNGEYKVKICQSEIEIKFTILPLFEDFKRVLLFKYPTLPWSKYLQRDSATLKLENQKIVTLHLWEGVCTLWVSGAGKQDWYRNQFYDLLHRAKTGTLPEPTQCPSSRPGSAASYRSKRLSISSAKLRDLAMYYTVKTLNVGGYEIEFPRLEYLHKMKSLIDREHPQLAWQDEDCRQKVKIVIAKKKNLSVHIAQSVSGVKKMWIYDEPWCTEWLQGEFQRLYEELLSSVPDAQGLQTAIPGLAAIEP